jgi:hypothetical protein
MAIGSSLHKQWKGKDYYIAVPKSTRDHEKRCLSKLSSQSKLATFATLCIDNPLARLIGFTSYDDISLKSVAEDGENRELLYDRICIPFFSSDIPYDWLEGALKTKHKEALDLLKDDIVARNNILKDFSEMGVILPSEGMVEKIINTFTSDMYLNRARSLPREERRKLFLEKFSEIFKEFKESDEYKKKQVSLTKIMSIAERIYSSISDIYFYNGLQASIKKIFSFIDSIKRYGNEYYPRNLITLISSLEMEKVFLDGYYRGFCLNEKCDYSFLTKGKLLIEKCGKCGGDTFNLYCAKLSPDVEDSWKLGVLAEIITAYVLKHGKSKEWIDDVIVHKEIQIRKDGGVSKYVPIDVIIHTKADEVIFLEVTSSSDLNYVFPKFQRKLERLRESEIIYDALVYVTSVSQYELPISDKKAVMLTLKHIQNLDEELTNILKDKLGLKLY